MAEKNGKVVFWGLGIVAAMSLSGIGFSVKSLSNHERTVDGHAGGLVTKKMVENMEVLLTEVRGDVKEMKSILIRLEAKSSP